MAFDASNSNPLSWISVALAELEARDQRRHLTFRESPPVGGQTQIAGRAYLNFSSNDYLGLAADQALVEAVRHAVGQVGWGAGASPLVTGRGVLHRCLETELARFKQAEAALLFPTGFAANVGVITALAGADDVIFSDEKNHASIVDGCRLSRAKIEVFRHGRPAPLRTLLEQHRQARRRLIVTDTLFSMDGDFAPLAILVELSQEFHAMLLVDEAHATGVWGQQGTGVCELMQVTHDVPIRVGTLSKALGSFGGFVVGSQQLIDWIANRARTYMFSTSQPEAISAAALAALEIVKTQPDRRRKLIRHSDTTRRELSDQGWNCGTSHSQIIPVFVSDEATGLLYHQRLKDKGLLVPVIRPPAVPEQQTLLRISLSAAHSDSQIEQLIEAFKELRQQVIV